MIPVGLDSKVFLAVSVELREGSVHTQGLPEVRPPLPQRDYLCHHWGSSQRYSQGTNNVLLLYRYVLLDFIY